MARTSPGQFIRQVRQEVSKVVPPTWNETLVTAGMVFIFVTIMAIFFFGVDSLISWLLELFLGALR